MSVSILSGQDRLSLGNGMVLRLLSGAELLDARREAGELARERAERPLCSNACLVARALEAQGEEVPFFRDGREVLEGLTAEEIEALARRWDEFRRSCAPGAQVSTEGGVNPNFDETKCKGRGDGET